MGRIFKNAESILFYFILTELISFVTIVIFLLPIVFGSNKVGYDIDINFYFQYKGHNVTIYTNVSEILNSELARYNGYEFGGCIYGYSDKSEIYITKYKSMNLTNLSREQTNFKDYNECNNLEDSNVLGIVHSHPNGLCILSDEDIYIFGLTHYTLNHSISMVICGKDRFGIYT